jgi:hypothetical protein
MQTSWTITEGAVSDFIVTYSFNSQGGVYSFSQNSSLIQINNNGVINEESATTASFFTSTTTTAETIVFTSTTFFDTDEEVGLFSVTTSASWNDSDSSIEIYTTPTTLTRSTTQSTTARQLTLVSAGTYLKPFDAAYPTVYAWHENAGFTVPDASNVSAAQIASSGQYTQPVIAGSVTYSMQTFNSSLGLPAPTIVAETLMSTTLTFARTTFATGQFTTRGTNELQLTFGTTQTSVQVRSTATSSQPFFSLHTYLSGQTSSFTLYWSSTLLTTDAFPLGQTTVEVSTTTTSLATSVGKFGAAAFVNPVIIVNNVVIGFGGNFRGSVTAPAALHIPRGPFGRQLARGAFSRYSTANSGHAIFSTQLPAVALSHAANSFTLPQGFNRFAKASWQKGVFALIPGQTRSASSGSSLTYWSLGHSRISITTRTSNATTSAETSSTYAIATVAPTAWGSSYNVGDQSTQVFALGGHYPTQSFVAAGGGLSATHAGSTYTTSGTISVSTGVTAFSPLPFFRDVSDGQPIIELTGLIATRTTANSLRVLAGPLTA